MRQRLTKVWRQPARVAIFLVTSVCVVAVTSAVPRPEDPPRFTEAARLLGSPDRSGFGRSVGLSRDIIVVGAPNDLAYRGLGYLFRRPGASWRGAPPWLAKLATSAEIPFNFEAAGIAVQRRTVVTGAPNQFVDGHPYQGTAQLFVLSESGPGATITESAVLRASDASAWSYFGERIAIDGDAVLVAAPGGDESRGAVYLFLRPPGGWAGVMTESARFEDPELSNWSRLGHEIGISGGVVAVGVPGARYGGKLRSGAVYLYERPANGWSGTTAEPTAKLVPRVPQDTDFIGEAVAISGDTVLVGAGRHTTNLGEEGAAYVFTRPSGGWQGLQNESAILVASDGAPEDIFGGAVAISGRALVVAAFRDDIDKVDSGSLYLYSEPPGGWHGTRFERAKLVPSDPESYDEFGQQLAMEGDTVVASARYHGVGWNLSQGIGYVFDAPLPRDFGDAPYPYPTRLEDDGARHQLSDDLFIGNCVDSEGDAIPSPGAGGDDADSGEESKGPCTHRNDEGVAFSPLFAGKKATVRVDVTSSNKAPANLSIWIDWNGDGAWSGANELVVATRVWRKGPHFFQVPSDAALGTTYARVRLSTSNDPTPLGFAPDGEVEDLEVSIRNR